MIKYRSRTQEEGALIEAAVPQCKDRRQQILDYFWITQEKQQSHPGNKEGTTYPFLKIKPHWALQRRQSPTRDATLTAASPEMRLGKGAPWVLPFQWVNCSHLCSQGWLQPFTRCSITASGSDLMILIHICSCILGTEQGSSPRHQVSIVEREMDEPSIAMKLPIPLDNWLLHLRAGLSTLTFCPCPVPALSYMDGL